MNAGETVSLFVSKGPERYLVPDMQGLTIEAAAALIDKNSLALGTITEAFSLKIPQGFIINSSPIVGIRSTEHDNQSQRQQRHRTTSARLLCRQGRRTGT